MSQRIALVLGANGGVGRETGRALLKRGWTVRALARNKPQTEERERGIPRHPNLEWLVGDALSRNDVADAAHGASVIVHAVNPAKYHNWRGLALPMLDNTIAAAEANRARVVLPGTVYNYGPDALTLIDELSPQNPQTRKGTIRVEMEERLRDACWDGRIRALVLRAGDFFGPRAGSSWFSQGFVPSRRSVRFVLTPGDRSIEHSWAYLPDYADALARLLDTESNLARFETFHFKGHRLSNGEMANEICDAAGISRRRVLPFPWALIKATAPLVELSAEMIEMRFLWDQPLQLDNRKLLERLGSEPHTPISQAVRATLVGMGCIESPTSCAATAGIF